MVWSLAVAVFADRLAVVMVCCRVRCIVVWAVQFARLVIGCLAGWQACWFEAWSDLFFICRMDGLLFDSVLALVVACPG